MIREIRGKKGGNAAFGAAAAYVAQGGRDKRANWISAPKRDIIEISRCIVIGFPRAEECARAPGFVGF